MNLGPDYFDALYGKRDDPWRLSERWYEARKRALTIAALPRERFISALEVGCSGGALTELLAARCDELLAVDVASRAVELASERLAGMPHVTVTRCDVSREWPGGKRDLVVLSEVGYYFDRATLGRVARQAADSLSEDGVLVTCHWRHPVADYPLTGDTARILIREQSGLVQAAHYLDRDFGLEVLTRRGIPSVAAREGLVPAGIPHTPHSGQIRLGRGTIDQGNHVVRAKPAINPVSFPGLDDI